MMPELSSARTATNGGLARVRDGRVDSLTPLDGLYDDKLFQILEDDRGNLWISCNKGVFSFPKRQFDEVVIGIRDRVECTVFGRADGMPSRECNIAGLPGGCRSRDGRLWYPTVGGATVIDPEQILTNQVPPPVLIEALAVVCRDTGDHSPGNILLFQVIIELFYVFIGIANLSVIFIDYFWFSLSEVFFKNELIVVIGGMGVVIMYPDKEWFGPVFGIVLLDLFEQALID